MIDDFMINPVLGAEVIFGEKMDEFQKCRAKTYWFVPRVIDSSGFSSFKSRTFFVIFNLRLILMADRRAGVYYQNFDAGQRVFWQYYDFFQRRSALFRAQIGRMGADLSEVEGKGTLKGASSWKCHYRNASLLTLPAPSFLKKSDTQAGDRFNDLGIDEYTKIERSGTTGIDDQLIGRTTRANFNQDHPIHTNHHLFLATAEDMNHPAYERVSMYRKKIDKGDPDYALISFNFKDMSDRISDSGKSFRRQHRESKVLTDLQEKLSTEKWLGEGLGIWARKGRGWYSGEAIERCVDIGRVTNFAPMVRRSEDPHDNDEVRYFNGSDPAKADTKKADDGALVTLRSAPRIPNAGDNLRHWDLRFVHAYKVRSAGPSQWSGIMHKKNLDFIYTGIMMDHGGGGIWIRPELAKSKQLFGDVETDVTPIVVPGDVTVSHGNYCLAMFSKGDDLCRKKWPDIKGDDNLIDAAHSEMKEAIDLGLIAWPKPKSEWSKEEFDSWSLEKQWALQLLDLSRRQLEGITVLTDNEGRHLLNKNNARTFMAKGKKDFAYACIHAFARFLIWLKCGEHEYNVPEEDAAMCG